MGCLAHTVHYWQVAIIASSYLFLQSVLRELLIDADGVAVGFPRSGPSLSEGKVEILSGSILPSSLQFEFNVLLL